MVDGIFNVLLILGILKIIIHIINEIDSEFIISGLLILGILKIIIHIIDSLKSRVENFVLRRSNLQEKEKNEFFIFYSYSDNLIKVIVLGAFILLISLFIAALLER